jgi:rSAM/selenodomain-associated transferase 1
VAVNGGTAGPCTIVFAKAPVSGAVKTRLQPHIGPESATRLYRAMVEDVVSSLSAARVPPPVVFFTPAERSHEFGRWLPQVERVPQGGGDLGERMLRAFMWARDRGHDRTVIVGSDIPTLRGATVDEALRALADADVVLGPSQDGGYYLVGARAPHRELFEGVAWGTEAVLDRTIANARAAGLSVRLLAEEQDVDTYDDVLALRTSLSEQAARGSAPRTATVLDELFDGTAGKP